MKVKELKELLKEVDDDLEILVASGGGLYVVTDADYNSLSFELEAGGHFEISSFLKRETSA